MRSVSLAARLAGIFALVMALVFGGVGWVLYQALAKGLTAQDNLDIVLAARHFRSLASEFYTLQGVPEHAERLDSLVLGNRAFVMEVLDRNGRLLIEDNPDHLTLPLVAPVPPGAGITQDDIRDWRSANGEPMRGLAISATLQDTSVVHFVVARSMLDRNELLERYLTTIYVTCAGGMLVVLLLGYLLIRASLRPVRRIARSAGQITMERLDTRIDMAGVPRELVSLVDSFNAMLVRLQRSFARLSQFTSDLAHDLRTPVSNMRGASEVALARPRTVEEYQGVLASNLEECDRVSRMIESVLFLARAEHPDFMKAAVRFDMKPELMRMAEYFEGIAEDAGVSLEVQAQGAVLADAELFRRAVSNLLANALRYTAAGHAVRIVASEDEKWTWVHVENPGPPIEPQHLERLFDRFYRADPSRTNSSQSTGLGLAIVRSIMELHGGTASVSSGDGTTRFSLRFPRQAG